MSSKEMPETLQCGRQVTAHNAIGYGAHRFMVPGNCSLLVNGTIAVHERLTMPSQLEKEKGAEFLLPANLGHQGP